MRIGGTCYEEVIDDSTLHSMDADLEEHFRELLREWLKDDDCIVTYEKKKKKITTFFFQRQ